MLRAQLSYRLFGLIMRSLPSSVAARVCSLLGLKIPTKPRMLAGTLMMTSGLLLKDAERSLLEINEGNPDFKAWYLTEEIGMELLCALSWLALSVLNRDDFGAEPNLFQVYAAQTFKELENLLEEERVVAAFRQVGQETRELYIYDNPTLRELAATKGVTGYFEEIIERSEREQNWIGTYMVKAQIRITGKLPLDYRSVWYIRSAQVFAWALLASVDAFRKLRPVLVAPRATRG